jgi:2,3-bisphosphoglycerate-dependent phosphoglycerate mutase
MKEYRQAQFLMPPDAAELLLIRHGESQPARPGTPFPLVGGQGDPGLAPEGRAQADRVAARLRAAAIDAIYVTPLRRTAQTAAPLAQVLGITPAVAPGLREVHLGAWEGGLFRMMVAERDPLAERMWAEERWDVIPGAEPAAAFAARVRDAIGRLAAAHRGQRVAAFTHGGVIGQALALASGSRPFAFIGADNGSISRLVVAGQRWTVRGFNDTGHLETGPGLDGSAPSAAGRGDPVPHPGT